MSPEALIEEVETLREENRQLKEQLGFGGGEDFILAAKVRLGLSPQQARFVRVLLMREMATKEYLLSAVANDHAQEPELGIVNVIACKVRKCLRRHGVDLETLWGTGFRISKPDRARILDLLELEAP